MGLDMYISGISVYTGGSGDGGAKLTDESVENVDTVELAYWRKHPDLHGYIVKTFADGVDDCQVIELKEADVRMIRTAVRNEKLPYTSGFFFGASSPSDKEPSIDQLTCVLDWMQRNPAGRVFYRASW